MGFYWKDKKDQVRSPLSFHPHGPMDSSFQLFARRGTLPAEGDSPNQWTSFEMPLREAAPIPGAFDFTRFVASSITFMTHLSEVSIYFDDKRLAKLTKAPGVPRTLEIPKGLKRSSVEDIMKVSGIKSTCLSPTLSPCFFIDSISISITHQSRGYAVGIYIGNKEEETSLRDHQTKQAKWWLFIYVLVFLQRQRRVHSSTHCRPIAS